jgi:endothelin-converting enzyme
MVSVFLGDAVGRLYVERHFPPAARTRARRVVSGVIDAYRDALRDAAWIPARARRVAQARLAGIDAAVGYPDEWRSYAGLDIRRDDLFGNWVRALAFENAERIRQTRPGTPGIWPQTPQTVNAAYSFARNAVIVPAAVLQPPVFDAAGDEAANYGAAGALVGHEIGHAFDASLADFDAGPLLAQLNGLPPVDGARVDALATARETLADIAGLSVAHRAYRAALKGRAAPPVDGMTGDQRFFLAWARMWRSVERPEYRRSTIAVSAYLPSPLRANFAAANVDAFYEAFGVQPSDRLYVAPAQRVRIW